LSANGIELCCNKAKRKVDVEQSDAAELLCKGSSRSVRRDCKNTLTVAEALQLL
jgi:hypothetical protein